MNEYGQILAEKRELERIINASSAVLYRCEWQAKAPAPKLLRQASRATQDTGCFVPTFISQNVYDVVGFQPVECMTADWWISHIHPEDLDVVLSSITTLFATGHSKRNYRFQTASGAYVWLEDQLQMTKNNDGSPHEIIGSWMDITAVKNNEYQLNESRDMYQSLVEQVSDGIAIVQDGIDVYANPAVAKMWGKKVENIVGRHFLDIIQSDEQERLAEIYKQRMTGGGPKTPYEIRCRRANGATLWVEMTGSLIQYQGRPADLVSVRDISERKHAEGLLCKLSSAIEQAGESIVITDKDGIVEYVNPYFTKLTGYSAEEVIGQTPGVLNSGHQDGAFYAMMWKTIGDGKIWRGKITDRKKDGSFYPATLTISPIYNDSENENTLTHFVGIQSDLTRIESLENQFHQAQKMEAIGTLVGGIAHDFNNMLAGITGNLFLAKQRAQEMPDVVQKLANIEELSCRAAEIIKQLLTFARKSKVSMKPLPLPALIKEALKLLHSSVPETITMHQDICHDSLTISGDGTQLHQVLMNLVNNARDALEGMADPTITVRLERFHTNDLFLEKHPYFTSGAYAHLSVQDNGCGIQSDFIDSLFEPFFTTKAVGKGTGLGLSMVFGAVKTHHGFVEVDSIEGAGSTFHIYLPLLQVKGDSGHSVQQHGIIEGHGELILLADDEQHIIEITREVLESLNYRVLTSSNGQEAVDIFKLRSEDIDLCLLDVVMPVLGGDQAAKIIKTIRPDMNIIFATGYDKAQLTDIDYEKILTKPFSIEALGRLIRQQLDS